MTTGIRAGNPRVAVGIWLATAAVLLSACARPQTVTPAAPVKLATPAEDAIAKGAAARLHARQAPLSAMALLGKKIFFDPALSGSGKMSCASCHSPEHAYAPANALAVQLGGPGMNSQGVGAVPSLTYLERTPVFSIGPDQKPDDNDDQAAAAAAAAQLNAKLSSGVKVGSVVKAEIATGSAAIAAVEAMVPQGGMDWDGRAARLADQ